MGARWNVTRQQELEARRAARRLEYLDGRMDFKTLPKPAARKPLKLVVQERLNSPKRERPQPAAIETPQEEVQAVVDMLLAAPQFSYSLKYVTRQRRIPGHCDPIEVISLEYSKLWPWIEWLPERGLVIATREFDRFCDVFESLRRNKGPQQPRKAAARVARRGRPGKQDTRPAGAS